MTAGRDLTAQDVRDATGIAGVDSRWQHVADHLNRIARGVPDEGGDRAVGMVELTLAECRDVMTVVNEWPRHRAKRAELEHAGDALAEAAKRVRMVNGAPVGLDALDEAVEAWEGQR